MGMEEQYDWWVIGYDLAYLFMDLFDETTDEDKRNFANTLWTNKQVRNAKLNISNAEARAYYYKHKKQRVKQNETRNITRNKNI
jgi:hypothetical protein